MNLCLLCLGFGSTPQTTSDIILKYFIRGTSSKRLKSPDNSIADRNGTGDEDDLVVGWVPVPFTLLSLIRRYFVGLA